MRISSPTLRRYGLDGTRAPRRRGTRGRGASPEPIGVLFIDGDHSYEASPRGLGPLAVAVLEPGGHALVHDAVDHGGIGTYVEGVGRLVSELDRDRGFERRPDAGGIAHYV